MKQTIKVADKPTADEIKSTVESNAEKLDGIVQELESGGMLSDPNLGLAALKQSLDELKNYVGNGKRDVASAITGKGIPTATDAGFVALVQNIDKIVTLMQGTQDANAGAGQILNGYTAYVKGSKVSGTIPSQGAQTITPGTSAKYVEAGRYLSGRQTIAGDANLTAANIVKGKSIFGVAGTFEGLASLGTLIELPSALNGTGVSVSAKSIQLDYKPYLALVVTVGYLNTVLSSSSDDNFNFKGDSKNYGYYLSVLANSSQFTHIAHNSSVLGSFYNNLLVSCAELCPKWNGSNKVLTTPSLTNAYTVDNITPTGMPSNYKCIKKTKCFLLII